MLICKGDTSYRCSDIRTKSVDTMRKIQFSILEPISPADVADLFEDDTFYFYDDVLDGQLIETNDTKLVGLRITYNADSTCDITIRLIRRSC